MTTDTIEAPKIETKIAEYSPTAAGLAELALRLKDRAYDLTTTKGDKEARADRLECVRLRSSLEAMRKELKAPALERSRLIDDEAKRINAAILALEEPIDEQIKAHEAAREAERQRKAEAEQRRVDGLRDRISQIAAVAQRAAGKPAAEIQAKLQLIVAIPIGDDFAEFKEQATRVHAETLESLRQMHEAAVAQEAEAARIAAEREELERIAAEQKAEAERLAAQRAELERQQAEIIAAAKREQEEQEAARRSAQQATASPEPDTREAATEGTAVTPAPSQREAAPQDTSAQQEAPPAEHGADAFAYMVSAPAPRASGARLPASFGYERGGLTAAQLSGAAPIDPNEPTIKLGDIGKRLGFALTEAFVTETLRVAPKSKERGACLYLASHLARICDALIEHVTKVRNS